MALEIESVNPKNPDWVFVYCTNPTCRGRRNGGKPFTVQIPKSEVETIKSQDCAECFCR